MNPEQQPWHGQPEWGQQPQQPEQPWGQQPPPWSPPPTQWGQPPAAWNQQPWGQQQPQWGQQPGWGQQPWGPPQPQRWPDGPERPGVATAAAVLGFVTGGFTALGGLIWLLTLLTGDGDARVAVLSLGVLCAAGLITGAVLLLKQRPPQVLLLSAVASIVVLLLALVVTGATQSSDDVVGQTVFTVLALPLPIVTAVLAAQRKVRGWAAAGGQQG